MQFGAGTFAEDSLGSIVRYLIAVGDPMAVRPILTELNGVDVRAFIAMDSVKIQDTLGQPVTAAFTMVTPSSVPTIGDRVRIKFYEQVIFAGTIDHVTKMSADLLTVLYQVDCLDWSQTLFRRKLRRNFTDLPIQNILDSILDNELVGEELTIGTIDSHATIPLADSRNARVFDLCRDIAGVTGQTFYVDFDQSIQMRSTSVLDAPLVFSETNVLLAGTTSQTDRETYRNVQTVIVKGTPPEGQKSIETTQQRRNEDQIANRAAIEGGTGIYEEVEEITHPTSNDGADIALLGIGYARLRLATSGTPRTTIRCQVQGYGFRAGQIATVMLPTFGLVGTYVVQRVSIREQDGQLLFHDLELTSSSLQQRAYESWLSIVKGNKITVQMPGSLTNNLQTFDTPGSFTWTVPAGVTTAEFMAVGASGGGGGGLRVFFFLSPTCFNNWISDGGAGGNSGKAITIQSVTEGQVWDIVVGAAGTAGVNGVVLAGCGSGPITRADGTDGGNSQVKLTGIVSCQGDRGGGGHGISPGIDGATGGGTGDAVSAGGGKIGGHKGTNGVQPLPGSDGFVEVRW